MVSNNVPSSAGEAEALPAAASKPMQVPAVFAKIPADAWQELDRAMRSLLGLGLKAHQIDNALKLRQRYDIPVKAIRRYARQLTRRDRQGAPINPSAAGSLPADVSEARTLAQANVLTRMPSSTQWLLDTLLRELAVAIRPRLQDPDFTAKEAAGLVNALARHQQALTRRQAQQLCARKYFQALDRRRREEADQAKEQRKEQRQTKARRPQTRARLSVQLGPMAKLVPDKVVDQLTHLDDLALLGHLLPSRDRIVDKELDEEEAEMG